MYWQIIPIVRCPSQKSMCEQIYPTEIHKLDEIFSQILEFSNGDNWANNFLLKVYTVA